MYVLSVCKYRMQISMDVYSQVLLVSCQNAEAASKEVHSVFPKVETRWVPEGVTRDVSRSPADATHACRLDLVSNHDLWDFSLSWKAVTGLQNTKAQLRRPFLCASTLCCEGRKRHLGHTTARRGLCTCGDQQSQIAEYIAEGSARRFFHSRRTVDCFETSATGNASSGCT